MAETNKKIAWLLLAGLLLLAGCAGTRLLETWKDPALEPLQFKKTWK